MGFKSRQPRGTNATPSRHAFCQGNTSQSQHTHAWAGQTQTIAPTGNGIPLFRRVNGKQLETLFCSNLAGSGYCVRTPRCISSVFFYATRRPRYNTRHTWAPITNQHTPRPVMLSKCHTLPKTNLARPPSISSARSNPTAAAHTRRIQTLRVVQERLRISRTNLSEFTDARDRPLLPFHAQYSHTVCPVRAYHAISSLHSHQGRAQRVLGSGGETCQRETKFPPADISLGEGHEGSSSHTGVVTAGQRRGDQKMWPALVGEWVGEKKRPSSHLFPTLLIPFQARYGRWPAVAKLGMTSPAWHGTCPFLYSTPAFCTCCGFQKEFFCGLFVLCLAPPVMMPSQDGRKYAQTTRGARQEPLFALFGASNVS